jgi:hypothetical protein
MWPPNCSKFEHASMHCTHQILYRPRWSCIFIATFVKQVLGDNRFRSIEKQRFQWHLMPIFLKNDEVKRSFHCFAQFVVTLLWWLICLNFRSELYASISEANCWACSKSNSVNNSTAWLPCLIRPAAFILGDNKTTSVISKLSFLFGEWLWFLALG